MLATFDTDSGTVWSVGLSADGTWLAGSFTDGTVRVWDVASRQLVTMITAHTGPAFGVALSGQLLASCEHDRMERLWRASSGELINTLDGHPGPVMSVALSLDGQVLASGSFDGAVRVWDTRSSACLCSLRTDRRSERLDIAGVSGITDAQRSALLALGAVEQPTSSTKVGS